MGSVSQVVTLNNEGVHLLIYHSHRAAIQKFTGALSQIRLLLKKSLSDGGELPQFIHDSTKRVPGLQDTNCFTYANAIRLSPEVAKCAMSEALAKQVSAVILFNIALVYHRRAAPLAERNSYMVEKAKTMYETAYQLVGLDDKERKGHQGTRLLVKAAITNNLAQIQYTRGDHPTALEGFRRLGSLFSRYGSSLRRTKCEKRVYQGMLLNTLLVTCPKPAAAA